MTGVPPVAAAEAAGPGAGAVAAPAPVCLHGQPSLFSSTFKKHLTILNTCLTNNERTCEKEGKGPQNFKKFYLKALVTISLWGEHLGAALSGVHVYETELVAMVTVLYLRLRTLRLEECTFCQHPACPCPGGGLLGKVIR